MALLGAHVLGIAILLLWFAQGLVVKLSPGGYKPEKAQGSAAAHLYNLANIVLIMVIIPLVAVLLLVPKLHPVIAATRIPLHRCARTVWEIAGILVYLNAHFWLSWARRSMGASFRSGGVTPHEGDRLVTSGPFRLIRHPVYAGMICFPLGLALLVQSWALLAYFVLVLVLVLLLMPAEERQLAAAYGHEYAQYRRQVPERLIPFIY